MRALRHGHRAVRCPEALIGRALYVPTVCGSAHILSLRPDIIKLDRGLIAGIDGDAALRALAGSVVMFGLELGASTTAEGVETAGELEAVQTLGMDAAQGYLLARPSLDPADWQSWAQPGHWRRLGLSYVTN